MLLSELLQMGHIHANRNKKPAEISDVYAIIYRIYCIPENKSYIGQTFSHSICAEYYQKAGILSRCKKHYRVKDTQVCKDRPLYQALNKYEPDQFEVYEEEIIRGSRIAELNQIEGEYIKKYNCMKPNGYNMEEVGKKYSQINERLGEYYHFEMKQNNYVDKTREARRKDITFGRRFKLISRKFSRELVLEKLQSIEVEFVRVIDSRGLRLIVREKGANENIRIYFKGSNEECLAFAKKISPNVIISDSFRQSEYKYQERLEQVLSKTDLCNRVRGTVVLGTSYLLLFYGPVDGKQQTLIRTSFGSKNIPLEQSYRDAMEFIEKFKTLTSSKPVYKFTNLDDVCNREREKRETP